jgi:hypothetical protein
MIRRRARSPSQLRSLRYKQRAAIGIGVSIATTKRKKHAHKVDVIGANRVAVFLRDRGCRRCSCGGHDHDHCHEVLSRAQLRGRPPEEIFNLHNCLRLCARCHEMITRHVFDAVYADPQAGPSISSASPCRRSLCATRWRRIVRPLARSLIASLMKPVLDCPRRSGHRRAWMPWRPIRRR